MATYQQFQIGKSMPIAAANPAGGVAGAGAGLGLGLAMMGAIGNQASAPAMHAAPPPPPPPAPVWHIASSGQTHGPFSRDQIAQGIAAGEVARTTLVWTAGMSGWQAAESVGALSGLFHPVPPPAPAEADPTP
jgi:membrane protease subunit (stomatin/prohibitin family)